VRRARHGDYGKCQLHRNQAAPRSSAIGYEALFSNSAKDNIALGDIALRARLAAQLRRVEQAGPVAAAD
jgi:hypothetical protein